MPSLIQGAIEGRGGQGVLFLGTLLGRMLSDQFEHVTVSPSYTAEMFGGPCHSYVVGATGVVAPPIPEQVNFGIAFPNSALRLIPRLARPDSWIISTSAGRADVDVYVQRGLQGEKRTLGTITLGRRGRSNVFLFGATSHVLGIDAEKAVGALSEAVRGPAGQEQVEQLREFLGQMRPLDA